MKVVGIDTATALTSAALVENSHVLVDEVYQVTASSDSRTPQRLNHTEIVLPLLQSVLQKSGVSLIDVSALAVSIGPGSFTGLRIGLSTIKGLAYGWQIPVVGVSTLEANAARVTDWNGLICSFLDARKHEVYAAVFYKENGALKRVTKDLVARPKDIIELVRDADSDSRCLFIGNGVKAYGDSVVKSLGHAVSLSLGDSFPSVASAVARLGGEKFRRNEVESVGSLTPVYLRPAEAEFSSKIWV